MGIWECFEGEKRREQCCKYMIISEIIMDSYIWQEISIYQNLTLWHDYG